jgi:membrane-bound lytic murein transglycosylase B
MQKIKTNPKFLTKITFAILVTLVIFNSENIAYAETTKGFSNWLDEFKSKAISKGISKDTVESALRDISYKEKVVSLDKKQPERTITYQDYKQKVIPYSRIKTARQKMAENFPLLDEIEKDFGVSKRYIVALWGIESDFGRRMGGHYIPQSLATLAYEGRRREFFEKELLLALKILDEGHIKISDFKGSWAGAMGQSQFMPSSFLAYAIDYNDDGRKDIWNSKADVFASIANYLKNTGWQTNYKWGRKVVLSKEIDDSLISNKIEKPLSFWRKQGVLQEDMKPLPNVAINASLIDPDGDDGDREELYLVYRNFKNIMKWNRSLFFATSVGLLADQLR